MSGRMVLAEALSLAELTSSRNPAALITPSPA
jgi:hypothetical protein